LTTPRTGACAPGPQRAQARTAPLIVDSPAHAISDPAGNAAPASLPDRRLKRELIAREGRSRIAVVIASRARQLAPGRLYIATTNPFRCRRLHSTTLKDR